MSIAAAVYKTIDQIPAGRIFGYEVFPEYQEAPEAVVRAVGRRVDRQELKRLEKGRFYTPRQGILGEVPVGDSELVRDVLYSKGKRCAYITGPALYNRWARVRHFLIHEPCLVASVERRIKGLRAFWGGCGWIQAPNG